MPIIQEGLSKDIESSNRELKLAAHIHESTKQQPKIYLVVKNQKHEIV